MDESVRYLTTAFADLAMPDLEVDEFGIITTVKVNNTEFERQVNAVYKRTFRRHLRRQ